MVWDERWWSFLDAIEEPESYSSLAACERVLDDWAKRGANVETIGSSREEREIRCATIGSGKRGLLAWGFPHPDEPIGASSLIALGEGLLSGRLELPGWRVHLVLCADPDNVALNRWIGQGATVQDFVGSCWRPASMGVEVDYGFALDHPPFFNSPDFEGRCRGPKECLARCGGGPCKRRRLPFAPLPESLALATALEQYRPCLVASMHSALLGGDYTFLLQREGKATFDSLLAIPARCGQMRHLGEALDRGRRWRQDAPDLIREQRFIETLRQLQRSGVYKPGYTYDASHSAGNYIEVKLPGVQFVCPESCLFRHPDFADTTPLAETEDVQISIEDRPAGRRRVTKAYIGGKWEIVQMSASKESLSPARKETIVPTRALLGVRAVYRRRMILSRVDELWASVAETPGLHEHPYLQERFGEDVPGRLSDGGAMRLFLTADRFHQTATKAQAASFRWGWPLETAGRIGNFLNFLNAQPETLNLQPISKELRRLQQEELACLPEEILQGTAIAPAIRSQLARLLTLAERQA